MKSLENLKILSVGSFTLYNESNTCLHRTDAMKELGANVTVFDFDPPKILLISRIMGWLFRAGLPIPKADFYRMNAKLLEVCTQDQWDIVWIDKGLLFGHKTLSKIRALQPKAKIVGYAPDDMNARHCQSMQFLSALPLYDIYFTTKTYNVPELTTLGCKRVEFVVNSYRESFHKPSSPSPEDIARVGGDIVFIGHHEKERADDLRFLADHGLPVRIFGPGWEQVKSAKNYEVTHASLWGEDYPLALAASKINLCFLRKINRDQQTQRTMEIPACGGFMLAERTEQHLELFVEGKEAAFFDSRAELLEKCKYYLEHEEERQAIAEAGRQRCVASGYSNKANIKRMLETVVGM